MRHLAATADRIDYWIRRHVVPCPPQSNVNPACDRRVGLFTIGQCLKDQYDAAATPIPPHLAALVKQLKTQERVWPARHATGRPSLGHRRAAAS
jgi:hypothetical protein